MNKLRSLIGMRGLSIALVLMLLVSIAVFGAARAVYAEEGAGDTTTTGEGAPEGEDPVGDTVLTTGAEDGEGEDPGDATTTGETTGEAEKPKVEFVLWKKLKKVDTKGWIMFGAAAVITVGMIVFLATRKSGSESASMQKVSPTLILVQGALCVALSFVLSYFKLFSMPTGGSITLASMLPLMIFANRHGVKWGMLAGLVYGILQLIQKPEIYHWIQVILDYPVAFGLIGLAGLTKGVRLLPVSVLIGGTARFLAHFVSGVIFFGEFVMLGKDAAQMGIFKMLWPNITVSFVYNAPYMFADIAVCLVIALLPPFQKAIKKALKY